MSFDSRARISLRLCLWHAGPASPSPQSGAERCFSARGVLQGGRLKCVNHPWDAPLRTVQWKVKGWP